jgi:hypothetical protein
LAILQEPVDPVEVSTSVGDMADISVEWAVPTLVLTVPGILLMLAVVGQAIGAAIYIPLTRRSIGGFDLSMPRAPARSPRRRALGFRSGTRVL